MHAVSLCAIAERDFPPCGGNLAWNYCYEIMASLGIATAYENTVYYAYTFDAYNKTGETCKYIYIYHVKLHENFSIISKYEELNIIKR